MQCILHIYLRRQQWKLLISTAICSVVLLADGTLLIITADKLPRVNKRRNKCFVSIMVSERKSPRQNISARQTRVPGESWKGAFSPLVLLIKAKWRGRGLGGKVCAGEAIRNRDLTFLLVSLPRWQQACFLECPGTEFWSHCAYRLFLHLSASQYHVMGGSIFKTKSKSNDSPIQTVSNGVAPALGHLCSSSVPRGLAPHSEIPQVTSLLRMHIADPQGECVVQVKMLVKMTTCFPRWPGWGGSEPVGRGGFSLAIF